MQPSLGSGRPSSTGLRVLVMTTRRVETASTWFGARTSGAGLPPGHAFCLGLGLGVHLRSTCFVTRTPDLGPGLWSCSWY